MHAGSIPARASKCVAQTGAIGRHSWFFEARVPIFIGMTFSDLSDWQSVALVALGVAVLLSILFRLPFIGRALRGLFSLGIMAIGIYLLMQYAPYDPTLARMTEALGIQQQEVVGEEVRIPMAADGHFWAEVDIGGVERRMLIDSGATMTALSPATAEEAGVEARPGMVPVLIRTANGTVQASSVRIAQLQVGGIVARDLNAVVTPALGVDILGMNFLSQLKSWRVEGRTLILDPRGDGAADSDSAAGAGKAG